ncbi:aminotransferase class V-fold PLP-dependent enzyme [Streptomyces sulfonofaciens]|uniref:Aminotransferase class V-fold PLP-dependent enzyme n=1 Tax=Streptomyces sulfonofaciens TaxID=68272 RepID=A0A919G3L6_9ACTN|nr:aminotransferase class V-fold PLP-dependent enzyme [Streptomyces sulfonofaciens]GHH76891.1 aminotransferase class V-fold PLP-dependent enzyme [Streptomyces sulfonofaciens]
MCDNLTLARLRATEYGYLDENRHVYLDHTGAGLPARSQLARQAERISSGCYGNPHSENPTSAASEQLLTGARRAVLRHFNADPQQYAVVFTPNATGAMRLVGEGYPFGRRRRLVLPLDNHNSVNGLREYARVRGARTVYVPLDTPDLRLSDGALHTALADARRRRPRAGTAPAGLFAYPAQSNFSGVQHPLEWIDAAHSLGYDVLLDAAAYVPANRLDLGAVHPDFVAVSWYKVFGYPTGVGCLIARRAALARLNRPWFAGGTIHVVSAQGQWHRMADDESAFEDGTLNFLSIPDVQVGLDWIGGIGVDAVHEHVRALTGRLLRGLRELRHTCGAPMVRLYGPAGTERRGGTVALNFLDPLGRIVDERIVSRDGAARNISLRTGCFCNPGAGEAAFGIGMAALRRAVRGRPGTIDDYLSRLDLPSGGAVRVSVGVSSNLRDVETFLEFAGDTYRDRSPDTAGLPPRLRC